MEECNPRARALYERLGYVAYGREPESWDEETPDGSITRYETVCTLMRKELPQPEAAPRSDAQRALWPAFEPVALARPKAEFNERHE